MIAARRTKKLTRSHWASLDLLGGVSNISGLPICRVFLNTPPGWTLRIARLFDLLRGSASEALLVRTTRNKLHDDGSSARPALALDFKVRGLLMVPCKATRRLLSPRQRSSGPSDASGSG